MQLQDANRLLDPTPMPLETGYERLPDGVLHVACRTDLHGCTGEMFEWWFRSRPDTQQYIWWHPVGPCVQRLGGRRRQHPRGLHPHRRGVLHRAAGSEAADPVPPQRRVLRRRCLPGRACRGPPERFGVRPHRHELGGAAPCPTAVCSAGGLLHIGRDTPWGCALRSHFYMGQGPAGRRQEPGRDRTRWCPTQFGIALLQHCYNEFTFLSRFLPSLFIAENRKTHPVPLPW